MNSRPLPDVALAPPASQIVAEDVDCCRRSQAPTWQDDTELLDLFVPRLVTRLKHEVRLAACPGTLERP